MTVLLAKFLIENFYCFATFISIVYNAHAQFMKSYYMFCCGFLALPNKSDRGYDVFKYA